MTYLEAVNGVMRRLRESTVSSVSSTDYSTLIGDFINDARQYVEERWEWISLEEAITITTSSGLSEYVVDGAGDGGNIASIVNNTGQWQMKQADALELVQRDVLAGTTTTGSPTQYAFTGVASDLDPQITVYPQPTAAETLTAYVDKTGVALVNDTDTLAVPSQPVVQMAYALALSERGDTGGTAGGTQLALAEVYIANAIMADAQKRPAELLWDEGGRDSNNTNWKNR